MLRRGSHSRESPKERSFVVSVFKLRRLLWFYVPLVLMGLALMVVALFAQEWQPYTWTTGLLVTLAGFGGVLLDTVEAHIER